MVTKQELMRNRRSRVMYEGERGAGKTGVLVGHAVSRVKLGHSVRYLDMGAEEGAIDELLQLPDEVAAGIDYQQPRSFADLRAATQPPGPKLIIVDAMQNLKPIANEVTTRTALATGADKDDDDRKEGRKSIMQRLMEETGVPPPPEVLPFGKGTSMRKGYEAEFFDRLWDLRCDVLCAVNTKTLSANENYVNSLAGMFDLVVVLERVQTGRQMMEHRFRIEKIRGVKWTDARGFTFEKNEDILPRIREMTQPKPVTMLHCEGCAKDIPSSEVSKCASQGHNVRALEAKA